MRGKTEKLFTKIFGNNDRDKTTNYSSLHHKVLFKELFRIGKLLDSKDLHDHCLETDADRGWFVLRDILFAVAEDKELEQANNIMSSLLKTDPLKIINDDDFGTIDYQPVYGCIFCNKKMNNENNKHKNNCIWIKAENYIKSMK